MALKQLPALLFSLFFSLFSNLAAAEQPPSTTPTLSPIESLLIKQACADVVTDYARAVNAWDLKAFVLTFTPDGIWRRPSGHTMTGRQAMYDFLDAFPKPGPDRTVRHVNGGVQVTVVDRDNTIVWSQTTVYDGPGPGAGTLPAPMDGPDLIVEYDDKMVRTDKGWKIKERVTTVVFAKNKDAVPKPKN